MRLAIGAVRSEEMGFRRAALTYNVPKSTLERRVKKEGDNIQAAKKSLGRFKSVFSIDQENLLKEYILSMESRLFGLTIHDLRSLAYQFANQNNIPHPFSKEDQLAGVGWVHNFLKRNNNISLRTPENTSASRVAAFNRTCVAKFFELLGELMDTHKFPPSRIYNCNKTGISTVPNKKSKILSLKGKKQVGILSSAERGTLITTEICFSATGQYIPPLMIFPRVRMNPMFAQGLPPETQVECHPSGWMQTEIFAPTWFNHFVKHSRPSAGDPVLLILDGHSTHVKNIKLVEMARANNVHILVIPPHTSHRLQPLDVAFMAPLSSYYEQEVRKWLRNNPGKVVTVHDVGALFGPAYIRSATQQNALSAFQATGICPLNPDIFPDHLFKPAETTDRELTNELGANERNLTDNLPASTSTSQNVILDPVARDVAPDIALVSPDVVAVSPDVAAVIPCVAAVSPALMMNEPRLPIKDPAPIVSPQDIRPFPKVAKSQEPRKQRKRGKTMVLTSTPSLEELKTQKRVVPEPKLKAARKQLVNVFKRVSKNKLCDDFEEFSSNNSSSSDSDFEVTRKKKKPLTTVDPGALVNGDFVLVKFKSENSDRVKNFVGQVLKENVINNMIQVKFMRKL